MEVKKQVFYIAANEDNLMRKTTERKKTQKEEISIEREICTCRLKSIEG